MTYKIQFEKLKRIRKSTGLSQQDVEENLNLQPGRLSLLETGRAEIKLEELRLLTPYLGINIAELVTPDSFREMTAQLTSLAGILEAKLEFNRSMHYV